MVSTPGESSAAATLQRFYAAEAAYLADGGGGDFSPVAATLDADCVIYQPASLPYGGAWRGHAGFEAWMRAFAAQWSALDVRDPHLFHDGDVIVSRSHVYATSRTTGRAADWPLLQLVRFRDAKVLELSPFYWDTAALLPVMKDR